MPRGAGVRESANGLLIGARRTQWPNRIGVRQQRAQVITASAENEGRPLSGALKTPGSRIPIVYFLRRARITNTAPARSATAATLVEPSISGAAAPTAIRAVAVPIKTIARPRSLVIESSRRRAYHGGLERCNTEYAFTRPRRGGFRKARDTRIECMEYIEVESPQGTGGEITSLAGSDGNL